jgi:hypothetical protein
MTIDELQKSWSQQNVRGPRVDSAALRAELGREAHRRCRAVLRLIGVAGFVFVTGWIMAFTAHVTGIKPFTPVTLATFAAASLFDLACLGFAVRALRRMRREALAMGATLADALHASIRAVECQLTDCRIFGYGLALGLVGELALTFVRLETANTTTRAAVANVMVTTVILVAVALTLRRYYRDQLLPRRAELRQRLAGPGE